MKPSRYFFLCINLLLFSIPTSAQAPETIAIDLNAKTSPFPFLGTVGRLRACD